ncbi:MAG: heme exporter protein CcmD [Acidimicrobiia bacterium]
MKFAGYVLSGYGIAFGAIGAYWWWVVARTRRAEATLLDEARDR